MLKLLYPFLATFLALLVLTGNQRVYAGETEVPATEEAVAEKSVAEEPAEEEKAPSKVYTEKEAKAEVMKALREKRIEGGDVGKYYEMISKGKIAEVIKQIGPSDPGSWPKDKVTGWRGDGSGRFPDATPPTEWSFIPKSISELKYSAKRPKGNSGEPMPDGSIREWLVWGPSSKPADSELLPGEASLVPEENEKAGESVWKLIKTDTGTLDFGRELKGTGTVLAHTNIYSLAENEFTLQVTGRNTVVYWVNGTGESISGNAKRVTVSLKSGWNSLTFKVDHKPSGPNQSPGGWYVNPVFFDSDLTSPVKKNILWAARIPTGFGAPIVVGDNIFVEADPDLLICLKKNNGKILWARSNNLYEAATDAEKKALPALKAAEDPAAKIRSACEALKGKTGIENGAAGELNALSKQIRDIFLKADPEKYNKKPSDIGFGSLSPASDGKDVYAWFAHTVSVCYDFQGNKKWIRMDPFNQFEHGWSSSPLLVDGKLLVYMRHLLALDAKTGEKAWVFKQTELTGENPPRYFNGSPVAAKLGGVKYVFLPDGRVLKPSDGSVAFDGPGMAAVKQIIASPIVSNNIYVTGSNFGPINFYKLNGSGALDSKKAVNLPGAEFPRYYLDWHTASPLAVDGLIYFVNCQGVLSVVEEQSGEVVYRKLLDLGQYEYVSEGAARGVGASPTLGGKNIYILGNFGTMLVIKPGRKYEQVAKNKINAHFVKGSWNSWPEKFVASPYFDGKHLFIRGEQTLYCIAE